MANGGNINIKTKVSVEAKQAEKQIKDLAKTMSTIEGQRTVFINADIKGADKVKQKLEESIQGLKGIRFDNKGVMTQILGIDDAQKALKQLETQLKSTYGSARTAINNKIGRVSAYIAASNEAIQLRTDQIMSNKSIRGHKTSGQYANEGRQIRLSQIEEDLAYARQANNIRKQISLLNEKLKILQKIDKTNRATAANPEIDRIRQEVAELEKKKNTVKGTTNELSQQGSVLGGLRGIASRYFSLFAVWNLGEKVAKTTGYFQQQQVALEGILGSATEAKRALDQIKEWALESPFQTKELVRYVKQLAAFGIENEKLVSTTKDLADISAGLGVDMDRIILAYGQVKSAAVLRGQELRQFTEAGIPMVQALADKFTELNGKLVTTGEVFKLISERKVPFEMVAEVLHDMTAEGGKFNNMQENLTNTLYGQIEKLKDMWTLALNDVGSSLGTVLSSIVSSVQHIIKHIKGVLAGVFSFAIIRRISTYVKAIRVEIVAMRTNTAAATAAAVWYKRAWQSATLSIRAAGIALKSLLMSFAPAAIIAGISTIIGKIVDAKTEADKFRRELDEIDNTFNKETIKRVEGLNKLVDTLSSAQKGTKAYNDAMSTLKSNYGDFVSDAMIESVQNNTRAWSDLEASIRGAIEAKAEYDKHIVRMEKAGESFNTRNTETGSWFYGNKTNIDHLVENWTSALRYAYTGNMSNLQDFITNMSGNKERMSQVERNQYRDLFGRRSEREINGEIVGIITRSYEDYFNNKNTTRDEFAEHIAKNIETYFPEAASYQDQIVEIAYGMLESSQEHSTYLEDLKAILEDPRYQNRKAFEDAKEEIKGINQGKWEGKQDEEYRTAGQKSTAYNPFTSQDEAQKIFIYTLKRRLEEIAESTTDPQSMIQMTVALASIGKIFKEDFSAGKTAKLASALKDISEHITDPKLRGYIEDLNKQFIENAGTKTGVSAQISKNLEESFGEGIKKSARMKEFFANWTPNDQNYKQLRDNLVSEYQRIDYEIKSHVNPTGEWKTYVDELKKEREWLVMLASSRYFDVDLSKKSGGTGAGGGWRRMFSDLFGYIKEAREEEKKLIESTAGLTSELANQINSDQLKDTAVNAFWSAGSPFQKFIDKMDQYGLESEIFTKDFLQNQLGSIVTNQIEATGTVNYEDVWKQLIEIIKGRMDQLRGDKAMEPTVNAMEAYLAQMVMEGEKFFSGNKVDKLIEEQLKELRKINGQFDEIRNTQKAYESIRSSSNASIARRVLGTSGIISNADLTASQLATLLSAGYGKGIANASPELKKLVNGGGISIANIGQLLAIREDLAGKTTKDMSGATEEERQANFVEFKNILQEFDKLLNQLTTDILDDYKRLMELRDPARKASDDIVNAYDKFEERREAIILGITKGDIKDEAGGMLVTATQELYSAVAKSLGGNGMPEYINRLFGADYTKTGVTGQGFGLGMWLGDGDLMQKTANYIASLGDASEETVKKIQEFSDRMALSSAIIKRVDDYTQKAAQFANALIDAMDANNGLTLDEYGNYTYQNDYSTAKEAISMIADFSSGVSGAFQSLMSGDIFGAVMGIGTTVAKFFQSIFGIGDAQTQKQQDKVLSSNKALERAMNNLQHAINDLAGKDKWDNLTEQIKNLRNQESNYRTLQSMEEGKKHGDADKAESYRSGAESAAQQIEDMIRQIREDIMGTADELASTLTDAMVEAFKNGKNAAREWRDAVREYLGGVLRDVLLTNVLGPKIQKLLEDIGIKEGKTSADDIMSIFSNAEKMVDLRNDMFALGTEMGDWFNSLPQAIKEMIAWNSESSELSGGISGMTEDTGRTLEGLGNSILAQHVITNRYLGDLMTSAFAQVQMSWFNGMLNLQREIAQNTTSINDILSGRAMMVRPLRVQME